MQNTKRVVNSICRAFWRRIEPYKNNYGRELPESLPVEFDTAMQTALSAIDMFNLKTEQRAVNSLLFNCQDSGEKLFVCSNISDNDDGSYSFDVTNSDNTVKYRHTIKTEEM